MKFAKELEESGIPEWKDKYLDYKAGKKKLKAVAKAIQRTNASPEVKKAKPKASSPFASLREAPVFSFLQHERPQVEETPRNARSSNSNTPLVSRQTPRFTRYGSILGTPPEHDSPAMESLRHAPALELPQPAIEDVRDDAATNETPVSPGSPTAVTNGTAPPAPPQPSTSQRYSRFFKPRRANSTPVPAARPFIPRMFSIAATRSPAAEGQPNGGIALEAYREVDFREAEFFLFLDNELNKIEDFYKARENDAQKRLKVLREQLHILREQSIEQAHISQNGAATPNGHVVPTDTETQGAETENRRRQRHAVRQAIERVRQGHIGKTSKAMEQLGTPNALDGIRPQQDYARRAGDPSYQGAKRKLKVALAEFHRGLELLKTYAMQNRTAFRKINKKFDKTAHVSGAGNDYMEDKVNKAHFVQSSTPDDLLQAVEDLYARYFERGNRKVAIGKLRAKGANAGDHYGSGLLTGLLVAAGVVFGLQGVVAAKLRLNDHTWPGLIIQTEYLLQIYAGYFLMLLLTGLFCLDAAIFTQFHINYPFIFEFDTRSMLHWKQLCELPAWFALLLGLVMWLNFDIVPGGETMYIYWPAILIGLALVMLFFPPPFFWSRSRSWFLRSNGRLLLAGLYPVEFRDFFLGDMFCSLTYALGNIELFFCLYAHHWNNESQCNSSSSPLLGFFSTLPGIIRLLQCVRRYYDSRSWSQAANGVKYSLTISYYMTLSIWRINKPSHPLLAVFATFAFLNSVYCIFWDLSYDWSLTLNPWHKTPFLRSELAFRNYTWLYYIAIVLDPILRFNWIFYVIFANDSQHSSIVSFLISLSEVLRRGMWVVFRVENEHTTNVGKSRAQRDPALPYQIKLEEQHDPTDIPQADGAVDSTMASARDVEQGTPASLRLRRQQSQMQNDSPVYKALRRAGSTLLASHDQDYERRRPKKEVGEESQEGESDSD